MAGLNRFKTRSRKREKATARDLRGRVTAASGATNNPTEKEDVVSRDFVLQHKTCERLSYSLKRKDLSLTQERALRQCKMPLWRIEFHEPQDHDLAVMRWCDLMGILYKEGYFK